jgi:hypothetical protein
VLYHGPRLRRPSGAYDGSVDVSLNLFFPGSIAATRHRSSNAILWQFVFKDEVLNVSPRSPKQILRSLSRNSGNVRRK